MIKELLERQSILADIACELYGDLWIMNEKFWGSPTEKELQEVTCQLLDEGYSPNVSDEQIEVAKIIAKKFDLGLDFQD